MSGVGSDGVGSVWGLGLSMISDRGLLCRISISDSWFLIGGFGGFGGMISIIRIRGGGLWAVGFGVWVRWDYDVGLMELWDSVDSGRGGMRGRFGGVGVWGWIGVDSGSTE